MLLGSGLGQALSRDGVGTPASCVCDLCVQACETVPGWMLPDEAARAMDAGLTGRLMLNWENILPNDRRLYFLMPAVIGHEGAADEGDPVDGRCTFFVRSRRAKGRCSIHDSGFKPVGCRTALLCGVGYGEDPYKVLAAWNTDEGRAVVARWKQLLGHDQHQPLGDPPCP